MKTLAEVKQLLGLLPIVEIKNEAGEILAAAYDPTIGLKFFSINLSPEIIDGIAYASKNCTADCIATIEDRVVYVATKGDFKGGKQILL